jgi:drug/metabolite transporter (DMT)-like permease
VASGAGSGEHHLAGDLMVIGGVAFFGAYVAFARGLRDAMPVMPYAGWVYAVAAVGLAPLALATQRGPGTTAGWCAVAAMGLVPTLVGHTLVQSVARRISPAIVGLVCPGETLGSIAIGALVLGTRPSLREGIGAAVVVAGATVAVMGVRRA